MATTTTIYADTDANLRQNATGTNYSGNAVIRCGDYVSYRRHGVFHFDVSALTRPSDIVSANLSFTYSGGTGTPRNMKLVRLNQEYVESEVTWNSASSGVAWTGGGGGQGNGDFTQSVYDISVGSGAANPTVDIKELVIDAINQRSGDLWLILCFDPDDTSTAGARSYIYPSENGTASNRPQIEVTTSARLTWSGTVDGDLDVALNWQDIIEPSGAIPTANDIALFNTGSADVTSGMLTCASCKIGKGYRGTIGSSSSYIEVVADTFTLASAHAGMYISLNRDVGTNTELRITDAAANDTVHFKGGYDATISKSRGTITLETKDVDRIDAHGRRVKFTADDDVAVIRCSGGSAVLNDGGSEITLVDANVTIDRVNNDASDITVAGSSRVRILSEEIAELIQYSGSTTFSANISGPIVVSAMTVYGGVVDTRTNAATMDTVTCLVYGGRLLIDASHS